MPRSIGDCPERPTSADAWQGYETLRCEIRVVTPMFGGGVEPGVPDPVTLIRPTSIRGHLRFWWRATRGAAYDSAEELKKRETQVWGDTEWPSPIVLAVTAQPAQSSAQRAPTNDYGFQRFGPEGYALFSARQNGASLMSEGMEFVLSLRWPAHARLQSMRDAEIDDIAQDVSAALWAWLNFGGLGARTRRGCGALWCKDFAPGGRDALGQWLTDNWRTHGLQAHTSQRRWPTALRRLLVGQQEVTPLQAWNAVVGLLQRFRQGEGVGRNSGQSNRPGRSRWPEPETIRASTNKRTNRHARLGHIPNHAVPRAALGLPMVFHFKDERNGDPSDTELYPLVAGAPMGRMASPLILKPLAVAEGRAVPMIACLHAPGPDGAVLEQGHNTEIARFRSEEIQAGGIADYADSPMKSHTNAVDAFLAFAVEQGFREVTP